FFLEFLGKRTPDHGLALQTTRYLLFEPSKGIEPLHRDPSSRIGSAPRPLLNGFASPFQKANVTGFRLILSAERAGQRRSERSLA
ncbi:hypothetical protein, partial [Burkholderia pseudomallei]